MPGELLVEMALRIIAETVGNLRDRLVGVNQQRLCLSDPSFL